LPDLAAGASGQTEIGVVFPVASLPQRQAFELRVDAEGRGEILRLPLEIPLDGAIVHVEPPRVSASLPIEANLGAIDVPIIAADDRGIESVTVWWDRQKLAWRDGDGSTSLAFTVPVVVTPEHHVLNLKVVDDQGATTYERRYVLGRMAEAGAADAQSE